MLSYLGKDWFAKQIGCANGYSLDSFEKGMVLLFASYLLGHFIFLVSSILDEYVYDPIRSWTDWGQISRRLIKGNGLTPMVTRKFASSKIMFGPHADAAVIQVQRIKARALQKLSANDSINAFQWSKARLTKELPEGLLQVQRFEADSKFFRSFVVVLFVLSVFYSSHRQYLAAVLCFFAILPALWRYIEQRFKATNQAYWYVIMLEARNNDPLASIPRSDGLTHAGGVVFRRKPNIEVLLVSTTKDERQRVLPKGHIEPGEEPRVTAVREIKEETRNWTRVVKHLNDAPLSEEPNAPMIRWFLMELLEENQHSRFEHRTQCWSTLEVAMSKATFPETVKVLRSADVELKVISEQTIALGHSSDTR